MAWQSVCHLKNLSVDTLVTQMAGCMEVRQRKPDAVKPIYQDVTAMLSGAIFTIRKMNTATLTAKINSENDFDRVSWHLQM
jgi:hypothetical protein